MPNRHGHPKWDSGVYLRVSVRVPRSVARDQTKGNQMFKMHNISTSQNSYSLEKNPWLLLLISWFKVHYVMTFDNLWGTFTILFWSSYETNKCQNVSLLLGRGLEVTGLIFSSFLRCCERNQKLLCTLVIGSSLRLNIKQYWVRLSGLIKCPLTMKIMDARFKIEKGFSIKQKSMMVMKKTKDCRYYPCFVFQNYWRK